MGVETGNGQRAQAPKEVLMGQYSKLGADAESYEEIATAGKGLIVTGMVGLILVLLLVMKRS